MVDYTKAFLPIYIYTFTNYLSSHNGGLFYCSQLREFMIKLIQRFLNSTSNQVNRYLMR